MLASFKLEELPSERWSEAVRDLERQHAGWRVSVEEREPSLEEDDIATWSVVDGAPFEGLRLALEPRPRLEVCWTAPDGRRRTHRALAPARLRHAVDEQGDEIELRVDRADGGATLIWFLRQQPAGAPA